MLKTDRRIPVFVRWFKGYLRLLLFSLFAMSGIRLLWLITYGKGDETTHFFRDLLVALWLGARFDLSAFCYLSLVSLMAWLAWLLFGPTRWAHQMLLWQRRLWVLLLIFLAFILVADFAFYGYFQDHLNVLVFGLIQDDTIAILRTVWKNYPVIKIFVAVTLVYLLTSYWLERLWKPRTGPSNAPEASKGMLWVTGAILGVGLGARGSLGLFPLEIMHTAISSHSFINTLSFNGFHALGRAIILYEQQSKVWNRHLIDFGYGEDFKKAILDFHGNTPINGEPSLRLIWKTTDKKDLSQKPLPHVIVVLMESWGSDWMREDSPTFNVLGAFAPHKEQDFFTPNIMPASNATIGSLGSLIVGLPHRFHSPFLTESYYLDVEFSTAPAKIFQAQGYQTHFIYGGNPGWRSIDRFVPRQGFETLHGESQIKTFFQQTNDNDLLHDWGVHDEFVFKYAEALLAKAERPQFIFILTTTNHPPYSLPSNYQLLPQTFDPTKDQQLTGDVSLNKQRLRAYQYSNHQLGLFLDRLKKGAQGSKLLIAATGDHGFYIRPYSNNELLKKWAVPLYLHLPPTHRPPPGASLRLGSHGDVFPTLYNLLFSQLTYLSLGQDLLKEGIQPWSFHPPSSSALNEQAAIIIGDKGDIKESFCKQPAGAYIDCPINLTHEELRKRLTSLMGTADFIFEQERTKGQNGL